MRKANFALVASVAVAAFLILNALTRQSAPATFSVDATEVVVQSTAIEDSQQDQSDGSLRPDRENLQIAERSPTESPNQGPQAGPDAISLDGNASLDDSMADDGLPKATLGLDFALEAVDTEWASTTERQLRDSLDRYFEQPEFNQQFSIASIQCRSTICRVQVFDYLSEPVIRVTAAEFNPPDDSFPMLRLRDLGAFYDRSGAEQFNPRATQVIGSVQNGLWENYVFFTTRKDLMDSQAQSESPILPDA